MSHLPRSLKSPPMHIKTRPEYGIFRNAASWIICALLFVAVIPSSFAGSQPLPRSSPEAQGIASESIRAFVEAADHEVNTMHSFMLVRHGHVVAEGWWKPESADKPHVLHSLSKSFTSTAVGLAVAEGKLSVDDPVLKFFPEDAPAEPSEKLKAMRVRDLLTMSTGHQTEPKFPPDTPWVKSISGAIRGAQAGHAFFVQHSRQPYAVGNRHQGNRADSARVFALAII